MAVNTDSGELAQGEFVNANKFNDEQLKAAICITSKLLCPHINAPELLWGPPGSGKTRIAVGIIHHMLKSEVQNARLFTK